MNTNTFHLSLIRLLRDKFYFILILFAIIPVFIINGITQVKSQTTNTVFYISPSGNDSNTGLSPESPFKTIQKGFDTAQPGEIIQLLDGIYMQDAKTRRNGTAGNPITITGTSAAIVKGAGASRIFEINHDYIIFDGFTIDGQFGPGTAAADYRKKLIYAI